MSARVTVTADAGGAVAVKTATTTDEIDGLADEAERLVRARHPGVVVVLDHRRTEAGAELRTRFAGDPLERWRGNLPRLAGLVAAVAADLGDLHDLGIVHGRIDASHVLVGADGRPRLCGFSPPSGEPTPHDDVAALARLLDHLAERAREAEGRSPFLRRRGPVADQRAVAQIVDQATDPVPSRRPHARNLANLILAAFPGAELPPPEPPTPPADDPDFDAVFGDQTEVTDDDIFGDRPWTPSPGEPVLVRPAPDRRAAAHRAGPRKALPRVTATTGLACAALVGFGAFTLRGDSAATGADDDEPAVVAASSASSSTTTLAEAPAPEVSVDGSVVEIDGERWNVGQAGDIVAVGDWNCDGVVTPVSYRPSTGDVFVFSTWADESEPLTVEAVAQVAGGRTLVADEGASADGCDIPVIETASGERQAVEVTP